MNDDAELQEIRNRIGFGLDCKKWVGSPLGQYLLNRASEGRAAALEALATADAEDPKTIRELQNEIVCAERFKEWIDEVIAAGEEAERVFVESQE